MLLQLMPMHTYYSIHLTEPYNNSNIVVDVLELFGSRNVVSLTLVHDRTIDLLFTNKNVKRLKSLLSMSSWQENLQVLEIYTGLVSSCGQLLRAAALMPKLRELELKWCEDPNNQDNLKNIVKGRKKRFDSMTRFILQKLQH